MNAEDTLAVCTAFAAALTHWRSGLGIAPRTLQTVVRRAGAGLEIAAVWENQTLFATPVPDPHASPERLHMLIGLVLAREHMEARA